MGHHDAVLVTGAGYLIVAVRATRLHNESNPASLRPVNRVAKRDISV